VGISAVENGQGGASSAVPYVTTESYRYDALGRRVWSRLVRDTSCLKDGSPETLTGCASNVTRTVWDGDPVLYELRGDGRWNDPPAMLESDNNSGVSTFVGTVSYVHGMGIDAPLALQKDGEDILPIQAWYGQFDSGLCNSTICSSGHLAF